MEFAPLDPKESMFPIEPKENVDQQDTPVQESDNQNDQNEQIESICKVLVQNIKNISKERLEQAMSFGKIKSHYYQEDKFAIIEFETPDAATLALSMHNTEIDG